MIQNSSGNLLAADVEALVNTVNTVGIMGKGIALQFRRAYPEMFKAYEQAVKRGDVHLGRVHVWPTGHMSNPRYIINFPTKGHWRSRSKLADIDAGLSDLVRVVRDLEITSIALPPLGCGNGGLLWSDVEPLIASAFNELPDVDVRVYPPEGPPQANAMATGSKRPAMTPGRAALVEMIDRYGDMSLGATPLEAQKLLYFLQEAGENLRLNFVRGRYGPYADNLRHVLIQVEGHFLTGYGDGTTRVMDAELLQVLPGARDEADRSLASHTLTLDRISRVLNLVAGYESMYGIELLASVHWVATREASGLEADEVARRVSEWSPRKGRLFTSDHLLAAWSTLDAEGWLKKTPGGG